MGILIDEIKERLIRINSHIEASAIKSGRKRGDIKLIAVSKGIDINTIIETNKLGITDFAENRVQEFNQKFEHLPDVNWHFIGRLQANKIKYMVGKVSLIHSLDSIGIANEINKRAERKNVCVDVLIEVNISGEATKAGIEPKKCEDFIREVAKFKNIRIKGLMTIAPSYVEEAELRRIFGNLYELFVDISKKGIHNIDMVYLSAGMTNDFRIAIEEGVNLVRIGTGIFGSTEGNHTNEEGI